MLCRICHDQTLNDAPGSIRLGWVIERRAGVNPHAVPAKLYTVNGRGWWFLTDDAGYLWFDEGNMTPFFELDYKIKNEEDTLWALPNLSTT